MKKGFVLNRKRLGDILVSEGKITPEQLNEALRIQKHSSKPLGQVLVEKELLTEEELTFTLGEQLGIPHVWLRKGLVDPRIVHLLPKDKALFLQVIPMFRVNDVLTLATSDPHAIFMFDEVSKITHLEVQPVLCRADDIIEAIHECYQEEVDIDEVMSSIDESSIEVVQNAPEKDFNEIAEMAEGSPVINLTNMILLKAIRDGASDVHIEPQEKSMMIRMRIDGLLTEMIPPPRKMQGAVVTRVKILANMDITERRHPQDGHISIKKNDKDYVSTPKQ